MTPSARGRDASHRPRAARPRSRHRWLVGLLLVTYLAGVAYGTFGPSPGSEIDRVARSVERSGQRARDAVVPGSRQPSAIAPERGARVASVDATDAANAAMFVPFGVLFPLLVPALRRWTVPAAVALSGCIELVQLTVFTHRSPQWTDIWWNGWGAVIGFAAFVALGWAMRSWRQRWDAR